MDAKKANQAEITQCLIERARSELSNKLAVCNHVSATSLAVSQGVFLLDLFFRLALARCHEVLVNFGFLYQGIEHVQDAVGTPYLVHYCVIVVRRYTACSNLSPLGEHVELFVRFAFDLASP